jgi:hypothetical protein
MQEYWGVCRPEGRVWCEGPTEAPSRVKIWFYPKSSGKLLGISNGAVPCQGWHFDKLTMTLARRTD